MLSPRSRTEDLVRGVGRMLANTSSTIMKIEQEAVIKTAIIEDQRDIREGLVMLINGTEGYTCTGSYRSMEDALAQIGRELPDVVLSDIGLPGMDGIEGIKLLKERYPQMLVLMLTVYDDD